LVDVTLDLSGVPQEGSGLQLAFSPSASAPNAHPRREAAAAKLCRELFAQAEWERYLNDRDEIVDAVDYVNTNPRKHDLSDQHWDFVVPIPAHV
jgi:hypothetical protein